MSLVFFGELMLRLTPVLPQQQLIVAKNLSVDFAGAETNVASSLARLGSKCQFVTKLPQNPLAEHALASLQQYGITTDNIVRGGERIGSYFIELGCSIRPSRVVYDRAYSSIAGIGENEFDWSQILTGQTHLHLSGILPALSKQCAAESIKAVKVASEMGLTISFDLNYRRSLWHDSGLARDYFSQILSYSSLAFGNAGVMQDVFAFSPKANDSKCAAQEIGIYLYEHFGVDAAITERVHHSANQNTLRGFYLRAGKVFASTDITVDILDRLGTGDAFAAGMLHGLQQNWTADKTVQFANAAFALAHTCYGDQNWLNESEIMAVAEGQLSGHIIR
ncbi:sugar kinase [Paraglaciecola polaris]|uniref:sugar kinase n=1 Tax=Paraglaciecola polaris TaxID=222814 RepID=UPI0030ED8865